MEVHFRRWLDIKACIKLNEFWTEKKKTEEGYDLMQKYRLVWDVMTHNINQLAMDETILPNSSYADIQGHLQGKKTDKGGQHVFLLDSKRQYIYAWTPCHKFFEVVQPFTTTGPVEAKRLVYMITPLGQHVLFLDSKKQYIYAWTPCHKFFEVVQPFTATGPAEAKRLVYMITPLVVGATKDPTDKRKQIFSECVHIAMDNYFSGDDVARYLGEGGWKGTMTCRHN
jgi:hypothetical protein